MTEVARWGQVMLIEFVERIRRHEVFSDLENCQRSISNAREATTSTVDFEAIDRIKAIVDFASSALDQSDPMYLTPAILENIRVNIKGVHGELTAFVGDKSSGHIQEANNRCDQTIPALLGLPVPFRQMGLERYASSINELHLRSQGYLQQFSERAQALSISLESLQQLQRNVESEIGQQKARLDTAIAQFQEQFSRSQAERQSEFAATEQSRTIDYQAILNRSEAVFAAELATQRESYAGWQTETNQSSASLMNQVRADAAGLLAQIAEHKKEAENIVGLISAHGMVHGYQAEANKSSISAANWSKIAVVSIVGWILCILGLFALTYSEPLSWAIVGRQFLISMPFVLLASFAAYQVYIHQGGSSRLRRRELEMASLDPFLATLTDDERNEIKKRMVDRFFGQPDDANDRPPPNLASEFVAAIRSVASGGGGGS